MTQTSIVIFAHYNLVDAAARRSTTVPVRMHGASEHLSGIGSHAGHHAQA